MKISANAITWMFTGCAMSLLCGAPAVADDTELLLVAPDPSVTPKPNVMFIIDTSGSMDGQVTAAEPYEGGPTGTVYPGACDPDRIYYSDTPVVPVCDGSNEFFIDDDNWFCESSDIAINGVGQFSNTLIQYRDGGPDGTTSGPKMWQDLAAGYNSEPVDCLADFGIHGDGRATHLWPRAGTDLGDWYTDDPAQAVTFGGAPLNIQYTAYDGNYLNYLQSPVSQVVTRIDLVKRVTKQVLAASTDMNVGIMRFNDRDGGPVILNIQDLDTNRAAIEAAIDSLPSNGATPLSETLYESALYWRGLPAYYGERFDETPTDPDALVSAEPEIYKQPSWQECSKNFNVLLSDGAPNRDEETPSLAPGLPDFAAITGRTACSGSVQGHCLDDVAEYLYKGDIDPATPGDQVVTTHTIGFLEDLPILKEASIASGGRYYLAQQAEDLAATLQEVIAVITDKSLSFSAPAVSVNTFNRTQNLNDLYITMFGVDPKIRWPGNLKKYRVSGGSIVDANGVDAVDPNTGFFFESARSIWTAGSPDGNDVLLGGAANQLPDPDSRRMYTNLVGTDLALGGNHVSPGNAPAFSPAELGLTGAAGEPTVEELIRWARGEDIRDEDADPATTVRNSMGDPLHSQPAAVIYGGSPESPDLVVYTATNDGYLHAIDGATGVELWSFVPRQFLKNMARQYFNQDANYKHYGIDGNIVPVVRDADQDGIINGPDDFVYLLFGLRRGGTTYMALDVTSRNAPKLMWTIDRPEMGQSWSTPVVTRMEIAGASQNALKAVAVIGGGYDPVHDTSAHPSTPDGMGAGIHIFDLESGAQLWRAGADTGADLPLPPVLGRPGMIRAIPNEVRVIDLNGDSLADRMYASDLGGQIWRFDIFNGQPAADFVTGGVIAQVGAEGTTPSPDVTRRFYNAPDVSVFRDLIQQRHFIAVSIGTGYRAHPFDQSAEDRFYSLRDPDVYNQLPQSAYDSYDIITDADLVEVSGQTQTVITDSDRGWKFTLPPNQKVLADSLTFNDEVFFVGFEPNSESSIACGGKLATNYLYRMSIVNGDPIVSNLEALDPDDSDDARQTTLAQGGIAPSPNILFPSPEADCTGEDCSLPPLGCVGVECFDPGFENQPVRTLWTQDGVE